MIYVKKKVEKERQVFAKFIMLSIYMECKLRC